MNPSNIYTQAKKTSFTPQKYIQTHGDLGRIFVAGFRPHGDWFIMQAFRLFPEMILLPITRSKCLFTLHRKETMSVIYEDI